MNQALFEQIDCYLDGTLNEQEIAAIEARMEQDRSFAEEVRMQEESRLAIELAGLHGKLSNLGTQRDEAKVLPIPAAKNNTKRWLSIAASIILVVGALWWFNKPNLPDRIYAAYHEVDPGLPVTMGVENDVRFYDAMVDYKLGQYSEAYEKWRALAQDIRATDTLNYYMACALLEGGRAKEATSAFNAVARDGSSVFREKAQWYLVLAYLRTGTLDEVKAIRPLPDSKYEERITEIQYQLIAQ